MSAHMITDDFHCDGHHVYYYDEDPDDRDLCRPSVTPFDITWLRKGAEWVKEQAELGDTVSARFATGATAVWGQGSWRNVTECGTALCFAGYIADQNPNVTWDSYGNCHWLIASGASTSSVASDMMGLAACEAEALYSGGNTADDVLRVCRQIAANHGEELGL